jgi:hypothetical protein
MSWYKEKDKETKEYLEWCFKRKLVPDEEPGFYKFEKVLKK